jgi:hypothetical protein
MELVAGVTQPNAPDLYPVQCTTVEKEKPVVGVANQDRIMVQLTSEADEQDTSLANCTSDRANSSQAAPLRNAMEHRLNMKRYSISKAHIVGKHPRKFKPDYFRDSDAENPLELPPLCQVLDTVAVDVVQLRARKATRVQHEADCVYDRVEPAQL